jgi:hypothetical protein
MEQLAHIGNGILRCDLRMGEVAGGHHRSVIDHEFILGRFGAFQPIVATGLDWSNDPPFWLRFRPRDPVNQLRRPGAHRLMERATPYGGSRPRAPRLPAFLSGDLHHSGARTQHPLAAAIAGNALEEDAAMMAASRRGPGSPGPHLP